MTVDLKIKDVAELLEVSEAKIREWISEGKIPSYQINQEYSFNRTEIEAWLMTQKSGLLSGTTKSKVENSEIEETPTKTGNKQYSLYRAIHKGGVYHQVPGTTKEEIIRGVMRKLATDLVLDADVLTDLLLDRENLMPTALNKGVAVPHTRDFLLRAPYDVVAVAFPEKPIEYGALDKQPVHTLFFLFACKDTRHLHLLAKIAHLNSLSHTQDLLKSKPSKEDLLEYVKSWESDISK